MKALVSSYKGDAVEAELVRQFSPGSVLWWVKFDGEDVERLRTLEETL